MALTFPIYENIKKKTGYVWSEPKLDKIRYCGTDYECITFVLQVNAKEYWTVIGFKQFRNLILEQRLQVGDKIRVVGNAEYKRKLSVRTIEKCVKSKYKQAKPLIVFDKWE